LKRMSSIFHILSLPSGFDLVQSLFLLRHRFSTIYYLCLRSNMCIAFYCKYIFNMFI
jgi:hypothetical protein